MKKITIVFLIITFFTAVPLKIYAVPEVSATASILMECSTGQIIFEKNAHEKRSMASTTKIMSALLCLESGELDERFVVDSNAIMVEGSSMGLVQGDIVSKRALCYGMLLPSGNDSANATAVKVGGSIEKFAEMMNERAEKIGMKNTNFVTPSGLEADGKHYSTAYDMALLTREALRNSDFREICGSKSAELEFGNPPYKRTLYNTNKLLGMYDGVIGVKTGFTDEAGRCLVSACERNGVTLICVTLNASDDWNDHMKMYDYGFKKVTLKSTGMADYIQADVVGSEKNTISVCPKEDISYGMVEGKTFNITYEIKMSPFLYAPVNYGDVVGYADYYCNGLYMETVELKAVENAEIFQPEESGFKERIIKFFKE